MTIDPLALAEQDYGAASIRIAWDRAGKARTLLFATVELIPTEVPPPEDHGETQIRLGGSSKHSVYVRHAVSSVRRGLTWCRDAAQGRVVIPSNDGTFPEASAAGDRCVLTPPMLEEPKWPGLVLATSDVPFLARWHVAPRVHHLLPHATTSAPGWTDVERARALAWLRDQLHFDLREWAEFFGSVNLIAPNPLLRSVEQRLRPVTPGGDESVSIRLVPRSNVSSDGLEAAVTFQRPTGIAIENTKCALDVEVAVPHRGRLETLGITVVDPLRGLLGFEEPSVFGRGIELNFQLISAVRRVDVPATAGRAVESYEVPIHAGSESSRIGESTTQDTAAARMHRARSDRRNRNVAGDVQYWFGSSDDDVERATDILRRLIRSARHSVTLVDPYAGAMELRRFGLAASNVHAVVRMLTSAEHLRDDPAIAGPNDAGEELAQQLAAIRASDRMNPIEIRVMRGARPDIHDRFLIVDSRVWLLGSSLNEFGSRGTMLLEVRASTPVTTEIESVWARSELLEAWVEARARTRGGEGSNA